MLALNNNAAAKKKGKVGSQTYLIFIALQCLAVPLALLLTPPAKVQRRDGSKILSDPRVSFAKETKALWEVCKRREILLLLPLFWAAYFNQYVGNFETYYFGIRARALIGFVGNFPSILASTLVSLLLDYRGWSVKKRINVGFYYIIVLHVVAWTYGWVIQEKYTANPPSLDWADKGFTEGFFVVILWAFAQQSLQNWMYYLVATKTNNISELSKLSTLSFMLRTKTNHS